MNEILSLSQKLEEIQTDLALISEKPSALIGFDGFTDTLSNVVDKRLNPNLFTSLKTIKELGNRILEAKDVSCNLELVVKDIKIGGNAPILASALIKQNHCVNFIGTIGENQIIEPLFQDMASKCQSVISLGKSSQTDALEFEDGKILFGKMQELLHINFEHILKIVELKNLIALVDKSDLFVSANWTMISFMNEIWSNLKTKVLPLISSRNNSNKRYFFVDLADPKKRENKDLLEAMEHLKTWPPTHRVILGLNASEFERISTLYKLSFSLKTNKQVIEAAENLRLNLGLFAVVIHTKLFCAVVSEKEKFYHSTPYCKSPKITTGAGDNFNAGFCSGLLYGFNLNHCLIMAIATAVFYIKNGKSPFNEDLVAFLKSWAKYY
jgi:hypothetical protein